MLQELSHCQQEVQRTRNLGSQVLFSTWSHWAKLHNPLKHDYHFLISGCNQVARSVASLAMQKRCMGRDAKFGFTGCSLLHLSKQGESNAHKRNPSGDANIILESAGFFTQTVVKFLANRFQKTCSLPELLFHWLLHWNSFLSLFSRSSLVCLREQELAGNNCTANIDQDMHAQSFSLLVHHLPFLIITRALDDWQIRDSGPRIVLCFSSDDVIFSFAPEYMKQGCLG